MFVDADPSSSRTAAPGIASPAIRLSVTLPESVNDPTTAGSVSPQETETRPAIAAATAITIWRRVISVYSVELRHTRTTALHSPKPTEAGRWTHGRGFR